VRAASTNSCSLVVITTARTRRVTRGTGQSRHRRPESAAFARALSRCRDPADPLVILAAGDATSDNLPPRWSQIQYSWRSPTLACADSSRCTICECWTLRRHHTAIFAPPGN
jgi:hypothetical protein